MATKKPARKKPAAPKCISSLALTEDDKTRLEGMAQEGSDWIGRPISVSAVIRGLIRHAYGQSAVWRREAVLSLLEAEIAGGRTWGGKRRHPTHS